MFFSAFPPPARNFRACNRPQSRISPCLTHLSRRPRRLSSVSFLPPISLFVVFRGFPARLFGFSLRLFYRFFFTFLYGSFLAPPEGWNISPFFPSPCLPVALDPPRAFRPRAVSGTALSAYPPARFFLTTLPTTLGLSASSGFLNGVIGLRAAPRGSGRYAPFFGLQGLFNEPSAILGRPVGFKGLTRAFLGVMPFS